MAERQRALPSWMAKKEVKVKEKAPLKNQRKRRAARAAFYCMNEAELVEAAVSFLTKGSREDATFPLHQQVERKAKPASTKEVHPATSEKQTWTLQRWKPCLTSGINSILTPKERDQGLPRDAVIP
ncbi:hypothetical protein AMECASPLE_009196 [Ameca splendens]|uniref:Uncharacterized protein n=1 Tax=Ameca splendens TaxID=208324 RepID=A0ABV0Y017_9TELE